MRIAVDLACTLVSPGRTFALRVAFEAAGRCTALFGPSGSGKSATLRCLAGMLRPEQGRIALGDRVLYDSARGCNLPVRARGLGIVFQDYALFPHLSVAENIAYGLRPRWPRPLTGHGRQRVAELLEHFELTGVANSLPRDLSGGQRQRVALARALAPEPKALLLDEPFAALDAPLRSRTRVELLKVMERWAMPVVLVTHDPDDLACLADTIVEYREGCVTGVRTNAAGRRARRLQPFALRWRKQRPTPGARIAGVGGPC